MERIELGEHFSSDGKNLSVSIPTGIKIVFFDRAVNEYFEVQKILSESAIAIRVKRLPA